MTIRIKKNGNKLNQWLKANTYILLAGSLPLSGFALADDVYNHPDDITKVKPLFQFLSGTDDYVPTTRYYEAGDLSTQQGTLFYLPQDNRGSMTALNRLYNDSTPDHMVSDVSNGSGYYLENVLGYLYDSQGAADSGLSPLYSWFNSSAGTHAFSTDVDATLTSAGFSREGSPIGYAYQRPLDQCEDAHDFDPNGYSSTNGEVKVTLNKAAGGIISDLWWKGKQFVNNYDYGRQVQTAHRYDEAIYEKFYNDPSSAPVPVWNEDWAFTEVHNPTEGGSTHSCPGKDYDAKRSQGSQLLDITVDSANDSITTVTRPILFRGNWFGGGQDMPIMWDGTYTKTMTLAYANVPNIIKVKIDIDNKTSHKSMNWELLTGYFNSEFNKYYFYDAAANSGQGAIEEKSPTLGQCLGHATAADRTIAGGPIVANADGSYAIGFYRRRSVSATNEWAVCNFIAGGNGGRTGSDASKISMMHSDHYNYGGIDPNTNEIIATGGVDADTTYSDVTYIVVGSLDNVKTTMSGMYVDTTNFPAYDDGQ